MLNGEKDGLWRKKLSADGLNFYDWKERGTESGGSPSASAKPEMGGWIDQGCCPPLPAPPHCSTSHLPITHPTPPSSALPRLLLLARLSPSLILVPCLCVCARVRFVRATSLPRLSGPHLRYCTDRPTDSRAAARLVQVQRIHPAAHTTHIIYILQCPLPFLAPTRILQRARRVRAVRSSRRRRRIPTRQPHRLHVSSNVGLAHDVAHITLCIVHTASIHPRHHRSPTHQPHPAGPSHLAHFYGTTPVLACPHTTRQQNDGGIPAWKQHAPGSSSRSPWYGSHTKPAHGPADADACRCVWSASR